MDNRKRAVDDLLTLEDEEEPMLPLRKMARRDVNLDDLISKSTSPYPMPRITLLTRAVNDVVENPGESFNDFVANNIPLGMVDDSLKEHLIRQSNNRLNQARDEGVDIKEISIGQACLPVWSTLFWDSSIEPLRSVIERSLDDLEVSQQLGKLLRDEIITKGNQKLEAARELGLDLDQIIIGNSLMPEFIVPITEDDEEGDLIDEQDGSQPSSKTLTPSSPPTTVDIDSGNLLNSSLLGSFARSYGPVTEGLDSDNSDSDSDSNDDDDSDSDDGFPHIVMNNFVEDQAYYSDGSVEYFYDAHVVGAPRGHSDIDFEFYAASEDDEVEDLPEMEFAVNEEAFYHYFETDGAIEIEVPGVQFRCTDEIDIEEVVEPVEPVQIDVGEREVVNSDTRRVRFAQQPTMISPSPVRSSPPAVDVSVRHGDSLNISIDLRDDESDASEEVTSDEEENTGIPEEVDGVFNW